MSISYNKSLYGAVPIMPFLTFTTRPATGIDLTDDVVPYFTPIASLSCREEMLGILQIA